MLDSLFPSLGAVFTGASVIVAILAYQRQNNERPFFAACSSIVELRQSIHEWDVLLDDPLFIEVGSAITQELGALFPDGETKEERKEFILQEKNSDFVTQSIHLAFRKSTGFLECERIAFRVERLPYGLRPRFPVLARLLHDLNGYVIPVGRKALSQELYSHVLDPSRLEGFMKGRYDDGTTTVRVAWREMGLILAAGPRNFLKGGHRDAFHTAARLINVVIDAFATMPDRKLRRESRRQRGEWHKMERLNEPIDDLYQYFKCIKHALDDSEWEEVKAGLERLRGYREKLKP